MKLLYTLSFTLLASASISQVASEQASQNFTESHKEIYSPPPTAKAGGDVIYSDDFSNGFANWTTSNGPSGSQGSFNSGGYPNQLVNYTANFTIGSSGNGVAYFNAVQYLLNANVNPQDALLTWSGQTLDLSSESQVTLRFAHIYRAFNEDDIYAEVSGDGGATWTQFQLFTNLATNAPTEQKIENIEISSVAANKSDVKIRFRWLSNSNDNQFGSGYGWGIDDFAIIESYKNDIEIISCKPYMGSTLPMEYHFIPQNFSPSIDFSGKIKNKGYDDQINARLEVDIYENNNNFYSVSSSGVTPFTQGAIDSLTTTNPFNPSYQEAVYNYSGYGDADEVEEYPINDTTKGVLDITDFVFGRDNGQQTGTISHVNSAPSGDIKIGNVMEMPVDDVVYSATAYIDDNSNAGQNIFYELREYNPSTLTYTGIAQTSPYALTSPDIGGFVKLNFNTPVQLNAGSRYLIMACHYGGNPAPEFGTAQKVQEETVRGYQNNNPFILTDPNAVMIRLNFDADQEEASFAADKVSGCAPLDVNFYDFSSQANSWSWDFDGGAPNSTQENPSVTFSNPGTYSVTLTVNGSNGSDDSTITNYIQVNPGPAVDLTVNSSDPSCTDDCDGSASANVSGGNGSNNYMWYPGNQTSANISNLCPGGYDVAVTDGNGCKDSAHFVIQNPAPLALSNSSEFDGGSSDGSIDLTVNGGTTPYSFSWTGTGGFTSNNEDPMGLDAGGYEVTVTDDNGCSITDSVYVLSNVSVSLYDDLEFSVYPNPTSDQFVIEMNRTPENNHQIKILDVSGKTILQKRLKQRQHINTSNWSSGIYFLEIMNEERMISTKKIVVQ